MNLLLWAYLSPELHAHIVDADVFYAQLKALGIDNILGFDWLASPSPEAMIRALEVLYSLGILDEDAKLTSPTGFQVAEIPLVCFFNFIPCSLYVLLNMFNLPTLC